MKPVTLLGAFAALAVMAVPLSAQAGGNTYQTYKPCNGTTCHPGAPKEKIVPHYYPVPTKTQHVYYDQPAAQPVTTRIIHHVPTPVYGQTHVNEILDGGQWTGPSLGCCAPKPTTSYCYAGSQARYDHRGHRINTGGCR